MQATTLSKTGKVTLPSHLQITLALSLHGDLQTLRISDAASVHTTFVSNGAVKDYSSLCNPTSILVRSLHLCLGEFVPLFCLGKKVCEKNCYSYQLLHNYKDKKKSSFMKPMKVAKRQQLNYLRHNLLNSSTQRQ